MPVEIGKKLRRLRKSKSLTLEELASRANLTKGFLSQVERDKASPSVAALKQVLDVMGEEISSFFQDIEVPERNVFRKEERELAEEDIPGVRRMLLTPDIQYRELDPYYVVIEPGKRLTSDDFDDEEMFCFLLKGELWLRVNGEENLVRGEDVIYLFPDNEFTMENRGEDEVVLIMVTY